MFGSVQPGGYFSFRVGASRVAIPEQGEFFTLVHKRIALHFFLTFQHPELLKWFKDFVGFRDGAGPVGSGSEPAISSSESQRLRPERLIGDSAMEIGKHPQSVHRDFPIMFVLSQNILAAAT